MLKNYCGCIVGLIHVKESRDVNDCDGSVWATGPCCNLIDGSIRLVKPIKHRGHPGMWSGKCVDKKHIVDMMSNDISKLKLKINNV